MMVLVVETVRGKVLVVVVVTVAGGIIIGRVWVTVDVNVFGGSVKVDETVLV